MEDSLAAADDEIDVAGRTDVSRSVSESAHDEREVFATSELQQSDNDSTVSV